jgi:DNA-binding SARP family transcriptional activator
LCTERDNWAVTEEQRHGPQELALQVTLLGPFSISWGARNAGPWPRPSAKRLCELVLVSPRKRVSRDFACEALFPGQGPENAARALAKALSMARGVLAELGAPADGLLGMDRANI